MKPSKERKTNGISYFFIYVAFMGLWGALIAIPERHGFPPTLGYIVWALMIIPAAFFGLINMKRKLEMEIRSVFFWFDGRTAGSLSASVTFLYLYKSSRLSCVSFAFRFGKAIMIAPMTTADGKGGTSYRKIKF